MTTNEEINPSFSERVTSVLKQTGTTACIGVLVGSLTSMVLLKPNAIKKGLSMGINWGTLGLVFFTMRDNMFIRQRQNYQKRGILKEPNHDMDALYISTVSGMATGGLMSGLILGRNRILSGLFYFGLGSAFVQTLYTMLLKQRQERILTSTSPSSLPNYSMRDLLDSFLTSMPDTFPITKMDDVEYLPVLEEKKKVLMDDLNEIENRLQSVKTRLDAVIKNREEEGLIKKE